MSKAGLLQHQGIQREVSGHSAPSHAKCLLHEHVSIAIDSILVFFVRKSAKSAMGCKKTHSARVYV